MPNQKAKMNPVPPLRHNEILALASSPLIPVRTKTADQLSVETITKLHAIGRDDLCQVISKNPHVGKFLGTVFSLSGYLRDCALIRSEILAETLSGPLTETLQKLCSDTRQAWQSAGSDAELMQSLRIAKKTLSLTLGLADLGNLMEPESITLWLSRFADAALGAACDHLLTAMGNQGKLALTDTKCPSIDSGLIVLGMGKYGAYELNYSSDIDIIILFDTAAPALVDLADPTSAFVRFAKQLNRILQERTGDGYVFRVDLRLRPDPGSTPLALPLETAFNYYEAYGQNWERAAFIKARAVAGDIASGNRFLGGLEPFVWRKYLDFAAIQDVHSIKRQIHAHKGHGEIAVEGHNVKLGRGGIREIEFFVQTQQLIAGGRRPQLRTTGTIAGLQALCNDGWISAEAVKSLTSSYWYLRKVEHRIQMVADEQSHTLPEDREAMEGIAAMMGEAGREPFAQKLIEVMRQVETHYAALFENAPELTGKGGNLVFTGDDDDPQTLETISTLGFKQPSQIISTVKGWHFGRFPAVRTSQARELLTELTPSLIESFAEVSNPDQAFFAFDRFVSGLPAGLQFFSILKSNPKLVRLLTHILGSAPRLADIITRKPHVFDGLIDPSFGASIPERAELQSRLKAALDRVDLYEAKLDQARLFAAEQKFLIGIRLINRTISARQAGLAFTELAETLLEEILAVVHQEFERNHGTIAGGEFAIIGMGRLGSGDLTSGSDLDLIFLYRHDENAEGSNGRKPLYPQQYFVRLVQRLIAAMSAPTAEGVVYELDFRLRPSGNSGPLATHLGSFCKYQREEAWIWESQALARARPICGDKALVAEISKQIPLILSQPRDKKVLTREVLDMRKTLDREKPPKNLFDVKLASGGMIDIEFISQWGLLANPQAIGDLADRSTLAILDALPEDALHRDEVSQLKSAWLIYNTVLQIQRVCLDGGFDPDNSEKGFSLILSEQTGAPDIKALAAELKDTQKSVRQIFQRILSAVSK
jgi:glutamate-ammonia-ligase adenylyltransferase